MEIINAGALGEKAKDQLCRVFVDAFYHEFSDISGDKEKLYRSFTHIFLADQFHVAMIGNNVAGLIACTDGFTNSMKIDARVFRKEFGFIEGTIIALLAKKNFQKAPVIRGDREGFIELVAISPVFQKQGVGTALLKYVFDKPEFKSYILEVASNNSAGISLYQKLGFNEFLRKKHLFAKQSGIDSFIWMKKQSVK